MYKHVRNQTYNSKTNRYIVNKLHNDRIDTILSFIILLRTNVR